MENEEKILSRDQVKELGLDKLSVITSDMLDGYTRIGDEAFWNCTSLTTITIPDSVISIGEYAFEDCSALTSITIPNSVKRIGQNTFFGVPNIVYQEKAKGSPRGAKSVNGYVDGYLVYADDTKTKLLACSAAARGEITIPNSVKSIREYAFNACSSITSITIPNSVKRIGKYAFGGCYSLTSITISNSVSSIGSGAFAGCSSLTSITIQNSVTSIGFCAFLNDKKIDSIVISDKIYEIQKVVENKCKAYKAFNADMTCRNFQYKEGNTYQIKGEPKICEYGFHACLRLTDVFNYYHGEIGKEIVVHEVELEEVSDERQYDSKVVAKKITIGKRIL